MIRKRFAEIDSNNIVLRVIVAESKEWCQETLGGIWLETFTDRSQRYNYAGIGFTYDEDRDAFIPPKPFDSWILDEATCLWEAPVAYPEDGESYTWNEETQEWTAVENETE
jgi:hypothetical protein